jgi:polyisoprenoid-binding protein YceI
MLKKTLLFIVFSITFSVSSQEWKQENNETKVTFKIKNFGLTVDGDFSGVKIETNFNSNQLSESFINGEITVQAIDTGNESRDKHLLKEDYFDEKKHPKIHLKSTKIEQNKDGTFSLFGNLTIKGVVKKIKAPLQIIKNEKSIIITSNFTIDRKDFKVGGSSFVLSNTVKIKVDYKGLK